MIVNNLKLVCMCRYVCSLPVYSDSKIRLYFLTSWMHFIKATGGKLIGVTDIVAILCGIIKDSSNEKLFEKNIQFLF